MSDSAIVHVDLGNRSYDIEIGQGAATRIGERLALLCKARRATVITDSTVGPLYLDGLLRDLQSAGIETGSHTVPAGEDSKSMARLAEVYDALASRQHARDEVIVALGGGVIGDLAGFAAATWMRGVPWVNCPTSLEAMIDASVGGKTGLNHPAGKNLIGALHQPAAVCVDVNCLATLPETEFRAGLAESVKHAIIADETLLSWHEDQADAIQPNRPEIMIELIARNLRIKAAIVVADERETAQSGVGRAALNFGHTIGHALEAVSGWRLRHGEAVSLGMIAEMDLAAGAGILHPSIAHRVERLLHRLALPVRLLLPINLPAVIQRLGLDKKALAGRVRFVVPSKIGTTQWLDDVAPEAIIESLHRLQQPQP